MGRGAGLPRPLLCSGSLAGSISFEKLRRWSGSHHGAKTTRCLPSWLGGGTLRYHALLQDVEDAMAHAKLSRQLQRHIRHYFTTSWGPPPSENLLPPYLSAACVCVCCLCGLTVWDQQEQACSTDFLSVCVCVSLRCGVEGLARSC